MTQNSRQYVFSSIIQICSMSLEKLSMSRMQSPMGSLSPLTHSAPWLMVMKSFPAMPMMHAIAETTKVKTILNLVVSLSIASVFTVTILFGSDVQISA